MTLGGIMSRQSPNSKASPVDDEEPHNQGKVHYRCEENLSCPDVCTFHRDTNSVIEEASTENQGTDKIDLSRHPQQYGEEADRNQR